jgi:hypothetical protein
VSGQRVLYADSETCGWLEEQVTKAGLGDDLAVKFGQAVPPGMAYATDGVREAAMSTELIRLSGLELGVLVEVALREPPR